MTDPILYLSMIHGLGGVYALIVPFGDDYDDSEDGEKYIFNLVFQRREDLFNKYSLYRVWG